MGDEAEDEEKPRPGWLTWETLWERAQEFVPWALAVLIAVNEAFIEPKPRAEVIPVIGTLIALPFARRQDRRRDSDQGSTGT